MTEDSWDGNTACSMEDMLKRSHIGRALLATDIKLCCDFDFIFLYLYVCICVCLIVYLCICVHNYKITNTHIGCALPATGTDIKLSPSGLQPIVLPAGR